MSEQSVPIPVRVYEGTIAKIKELTNCAERAEARPVLEAAREHERDHRGEYVMNEKGELVFVRHGVHCEVCKAIRAYDVASAAGEERP